jgi:hypothetical protein
VRQILLAREETQERPALQRDVVANGTAQHRIAGFKRIEHRALRDRTFDVKRNLEASTLRQRSQMLRQYHSDHGNAIIVFDHKSPQRLHLDRKHSRKIAHNRRPVVSGIGRSIHLSAVVPK